VVDAVVTVAASGSGPLAGTSSHVVAELIAPAECSSRVWVVDAEVRVCVTVALNVAERIVDPSSAVGMAISK
jgi:hypothetical protein